MQFQETTKFYEKIVKMNKLSRKISKKLFIQFSVNAFFPIYILYNLYFSHTLFLKSQHFHLKFNFYFVHPDFLFILFNMCV